MALMVSVILSDACSSKDRISLYVGLTRKISDWLRERKGKRDRPPIPDFGYYDHQSHSSPTPMTAGCPAGDLVYAKLPIP